MSTAILSSLLEQHSTFPSVSKQIEIKAIDEALQVRAATDQDKVKEYAELYKADRHALPPIVIFEDPATFDHAARWYVADGNHRLAGARVAELREIDAIIKQGTRRDALLYAISDANHAHGLPLSNADKRAMVTLLLEDPEWSQWSNREIARRCHVSAPFVGNIRPTVNGSQTTKRKSADGRTRDVSAIGPKGPVILDIEIPDPDLVGSNDDEGHATVAKPEDVEAIAARNDVQSLAESRKSDKPVRVRPIRITDREGLFVCIGADSAGGNKGWTAAHLVKVITAEEAKTEQLRKDVIDRAKDETSDYLGIPVTWRGAAAGTWALGTLCDTLTLLTREEWARRVEKGHLTPNEPRTEATPSVAQPTAAEVQALLTSNDFFLETIKDLHQTKREIVAACYLTAEAHRPQSDPGCTRDDLKRILGHTPDVHPAQLVKTGEYIRRAGTGGFADCTYHITDEAAAAIRFEDNLSASPGESDTANEPDVLDPDSVQAESDKPAERPKKKTKAELARLRNQCVADQLVVHLAQGKTGNLSIHQAAALAVIVGLEDNGDLTYGPKLVENALYELTKAVADQIAYHLRGRTSKVDQLPPLPELCAMVGADYDTFLARATSAQTEEEG